MNIYLNDADGRKERKLTGLSINKKAGLLSAELIAGLKKLLSLSSKDILLLSQNATTSLIKATLPILKQKKYEVYISTHEVKYFKTLFKDGVLPTKYATYPNYTKQKSEGFMKKDVNFFETDVLIDRIKQILNSREPAIIILSHVSRMTGELLVTEKLYKKIKRINSKNILIVDGAQAVGAIKVNVKKLSDIYIGVTSKFIGAEPHLSFCWIRENIIKKYQIDQWRIDANEYVKEIYSATQAMNNLKKNKNISDIREYLERKLLKHNITIWKPQSQIDNILLIPQNKGYLKKIIANLFSKGIIISSNTNWSIEEPKLSCLRISISSRTTKKQIDSFIKILDPIFPLENPKKNSTSISP